MFYEMVFGIRPTEQLKLVHNEVEPIKTPELSSGVSFSCAPIYLDTLRIGNEVEKFEDQHALSGRMSKGFYNFADERIIDLRPLVSKGIKFPMFRFSMPDDLRAFNSCQDYDPQLQMAINSRTGNFSSRKILGNMVRNNSFNLDNYDEVKKKVSWFYRLDPERSPMLWTPVSKHKREDNKLLRQTDYFRFVYSCFVNDDPYNEEEVQKVEEELNGVHYWYKDASNMPSVVRPLKLSDYIETYSRKGDSPAFRNFDDRVLNRHFEVDGSEYLYNKLLNLYNNKILVLEYRRVNLTVTDKTQPCPILNSYLNSGWTVINQLEEDQELTEQEVIQDIFRDLQKEIKSERVFKECQNGKESEFGGFIASTYNVYESNGENTFKVGENISVGIYKTTFVDVHDTLLEDQDVVFDLETNLLFGKVRSCSSGGNNLVDLYNHPDSLKCRVLKESPEGISFKYVCNKNKKPINLYANTHGIITKIRPEVDSDFKDGLYVIKRDEQQVVAAYIKEENYAKYGIFISKEMAKHFTDVIGNFDVMAEQYKNFRKDLYETSVYERKMKEIDKLSALKDKELDLKRVELYGKRKEQDYKLEELQLKAANIEREIVALAEKESLESLKMVNIGGVPLLKFIQEVSNVLK